MNRFESNAEIPPCLAVVVPVFNEETTIAHVLEQVLAQRPVQEVVVVDDASRDKTWEVLQRFAGDSRVRLFRHERNQGKGAALRTGFARPRRLHHRAGRRPGIRPGRISSSCWSRCWRRMADVVFGSRFRAAGAHRVLYFWHSLGNRFLTTMSNMVTDLNLTDMEACYKLFRREVLEKITIVENRFGFEPEIVAKVSRLRLRIYEVPISYHGRTYDEGKKIGWRDGFSAIRCILKYRFLS